MEKYINIYECVKSPFVKDILPWYKVLDEIKYGYEFGELVERAREIGKGNEGFDEFKSTKIPSYTVNAAFEERRHSNQIISTTGLLYLDIDATLNLDFSNPLIHAAYKSVSGTGMSIIIKARNLDRNNIKSVYSFMQENLAVPLDFKSADISRQTIFSYDPNIYVNECSNELDAYEIFNEYNERRVNKPILYKKKEISTGLLYQTPENVKNFKKANLGLEVRWDNIDEFSFEGSYQIFDVPIDIVKVYIPMRIKVGARYHTISAILNNYLYLNPWLDDYRVKGFLDNINSRCDEPLTKEELNHIYIYKIQALRAGVLEPIYNKKRSVLYSPDSSKELQRKINGMVSGKRRTENNYNKILTMFEDWDYNESKPTNLIFTKKAGVSIGTFKKYIATYPVLKDMREVIKSYY